MKYRFIEQEKNRYSLTTLCRVLSVSRSGFYSWQRSGHKREVADQEIVQAIRRVHAKSEGRYGSPRVYRELRADGLFCSKPRIEKLMKCHGIVGKHKRKFKVTTDSGHGLPVAKNILAGNFSREKMNEAWVGDMTYVRTGEGWLYLAVLIDLFSRRVVGWAMDKTLSRDLPLRALHMAAQGRKPPPGLLHHTDRGSQYASADYQAALKQYGMICSMSAKGRCYDNAVAESFFHSLKVELIYGQRFASREEAKRKIFQYMEVFYNKERLHSSLDYFSPVVYEQRALLKVR